MESNNQKTKIEESDVALWIGQEVMNKNIQIKQLVDEVNRLNRIIEDLKSTGKQGISEVK